MESQDKSKEPRIVTLHDSMEEAEKYRMRQEQAHNRQFQIGRSGDRLAVFTYEDHNANDVRRQAELMAQPVRVQSDNAPRSPMSDERREAVRKWTAEERARITADLHAPSRSNKR